MPGSLSTAEPLPLRLTDHFTLREFERSETAARLGIDNTAPDAVLPNIAATAQLMERIRTRLWRSCGYEVPLRITSGYRCPALDAAVGGRSGDHPRGMAADFEAADNSVTPAEIASYLRVWVDDLGIGQLILEYPRRPGGGWVHVSTRRPDKDINRAIVMHDGGVVDVLA